MIRIYTGHPGLGVCEALDNMHRDRKRIFVDLLKWDVPVLHGAFELDGFDTSDAVYLVEARENGEHLGSLRLLPTEKPHLLGTLFPHLCEGPVPTGPRIFEITRGCLSPRLRAAERLRVRNKLTSATIVYGLRRGLSHFTCVADSGWLKQISTLGWDCQALGAPQRISGVMTGALQIAVADQAVEKLRAGGTFSEVRLLDADPFAELAA